VRTSGPSSYTTSNITKRCYSPDGQSDRPSARVAHRPSELSRDKRAGLLPPQAREGTAAITEVVAGIRRSHGKAPDKKHAADADILRDILKVIPDLDVRSVRDRALLAFGMAGAFRRSELVALRLSDVAFVPEGLRVTIPRSKTDPGQARPRDQPASVPRLCRDLDRDRGSGARRYQEHVRTRRRDGRPARIRCGGIKLSDTGR
jgi:integrase